VLDVDDMAATLVRPFGGLTAVGERVALEWVIYFPWDTPQRKFLGETVHSIRSTAG